VGVNPPPQARRGQEVIKEMSLRVCRHYKPSYAYTGWVVKSDGFPWNGWLELVDDTMSIIENSFHAGLYWEYLKHLMENPKCRREAEITLREIKREIKSIEEEWKNVTSDC